MYEKIKNGTQYRVNGIDCNIPPEGMVYNHYTGKLERVGVYQRSVIKENQYWERVSFPEDYQLKRRKERIAQNKDPEHVDQELQAFRIQEWFRRVNGFWFMNNGVPTYITGLHYFYLNHWRLDTGYPKFRSPDMEFFYFLEYCIQDPNSLGMIECTKRRQGKTVRAGVFLYDYVSRTKRARSGIQSKTNSDARDNVFARGVIMPFKQLPDFFMPVYDTEKGLTPKSELRFFKPNKRGRNQDEYDPSGELESDITFRSSEEFAYDGTKLHRYVGDEVGKTKEANVYERHQVVSFCLQLDGEIIGKALYTTTVEEMENGGDEFKQLWDASDFNDKNDNGRTRSGLYRYFLPAYKTLYYDKYGYPDEEKAKQFYMNEREALADDPRAQASYIRKNPFTIEEAFWNDGESCLFDAIKINKQLESVSWLPENEVLVRGNFLWEDGMRDTNVIFVKDKKGKFLLHKDLDLNQGWNAVAVMGTKKKPLNTTKLVAGADPFDHNTTVDSRRSDGAGYVYHKFDATEKLSETFVCQYLFRPQTSDIYYEDMLKMCHFFGCKLLPEDNKIGIIKYFEVRGYERFLMKLPGSKKYGISANSKTHQQMVEELELYVYENVDKIIYKDLLSDLLKFDIKKTTKFDAAMAAGWTLVGAGKKKFTNTQPEKKKIYDIKDIFPI
jgi:hypothetical protein